MRPNTAVGRTEDAGASEYLLVQPDGVARACGRQPVQRIGMFLAVLELVRQFRVRFEQDGDGPIALVLRDEDDQED